MNPNSGTPRWIRFHSLDGIFFELERPLAKLKVQPEMDAILLSMLAAENSDFGVTGKLLAETLVVDATGNVDGSYRSIRLRDRWTDDCCLKTLKTWHASGVTSIAVL